MPYVALYINKVLKKQLYNVKKKQQKQKQEQDFF